MKRIAVIAVLLVGLSGCGSLGPMQKMDGPIGTPVFDVIALSTINDGSDEIIFKEKARVYNKQDIKDDKYASHFGIFIITQKGVYALKWDVRSYQYNMLYSVSFSDIDTLLEANASIAAWIDSNVFVIKDKYGDEMGFHMQGLSAAKSIINKFKTKN
ncbi:complement C1q domain-containing protein [Shewanella algae]|uniref:hypothetical protein n=1 Tax=Shewanella algae TaxID=38313 RepID=UPI0008DDBA46|nr:hypothetical protein [Shewanella algae]MBO2581979.1 hypothetical protein [Shewanella algae]MBO2590598.1 hypothetical protein [Shewanella algae]MBO2683253.1 hypothetical protein [Shewanella algae]OHY50917.1 hypothetical protein BEH76_20160 [Shewanella algae]OHY53105.1 hypothetical protein BEH76_08150 [Shewanella algae]